jgi:hypothetical protein
MAYLCPITNRKLAATLKVFNEHEEFLHEVPGDEHVVVWLRSKAYTGVGGKRRITHLIKIEPDARMVAGALQRPPKTVVKENLDGWRVWTHTGAADTWSMNTEHVARANSVNRDAT